jgi:hypothetical protein
VSYDVKSLDFYDFALAVGTSRRVEGQVRAGHDTDKDARGKPFPSTAEGMSNYRAVLRAEAWTPLHEEPGRMTALLRDRNKKDSLALSERRARAVLAALVAAGIEAPRRGATGYGQSHPVAHNATEGGRVRNRRVELVPR